jgi:hypothetical protein
MNRVFRRLALAATASGAFAACSAAPQEKQATSVAPLDPNQVAPQTSYTITLKSVSVVQAQEPNQAPSTAAAGFGAAASSESCVTVGGDDNSSRYWTPDKGFVDAAQLGVKVQPPQGSPYIPFHDGNPVYYGCVLGTPQPNGTISTSAATGALLTVCAESFQNALLGDNLAVNFTVNPGDQVHLALALDNVEQAQVSALAANISSNATTDLKLFGDVAMLTGTALGAASGYGAIAAVIGVVGTASALDTDLINAGSSPPCSVDCEAENASSCIGGLMGGPTGYTPTNVGPVAGDCWNDIIGRLDTYNEATCEYTGGQPDTIRIVDPATMSDLTAERLQQMTADGPVTFEFTPSYNANSNTCMIAARNGGTITPPWSSPMFMSGCASNLKIDVTISRDWATGLAASAKSADMAVVRAPGRIDTINTQVAAGSFQLVHRQGQGTSFTPQLVPPGASEENVGPSTTAVAVSRTAGNTDVFWVDANGGMYTDFEVSPWDSWSEKTIVVPTRYFKGHRTHTSILPGNAQMTALARTPDNLDVYAIGTDGNVYTSYWNSWSGLDAYGLPNWASPFAITTSTCADTDVACSGAGAPGGAIASVARDPQTVHVFFIGKDGGVWSSYWTPSSGWVTQEIYGPSSRIQRGGAVAAPGAGISATARTSGNLDVFFIGADGGLWSSSWSANGGGWGTTEIPGTAGTGMPGTSVSAVSRQPGALDVIFQGPGESTLRWVDWSQGPGWTLKTIPTTGGGDLGGGAPLPGRFSLVAPTSFSLQAFYLDGFHGMNTLTWSDPTCNTLSSQGCSQPPGNFAWSAGSPLAAP